MLAPILIFIAVGFLGAFISTLTWGIHLLIRKRPHRVMGSVLLLVSLLLFILIYNVMAASPQFDFVERCGPDGAGGCGMVTQTPEEVRASIRREFLSVLLLYIGVPTALGVSLLLFLLQRTNRVSQQPSSSTPTDAE